MDAHLPPAFSELEAFVPGSALARYSQRQAKRLATPMPEIRAFYEAIMPRLEAIVEHLNGFPLERLPPPEQRLPELCLSLAQIGNCIALWHAPDQANAFAATRMEAVLDD